VKWNDLVEQRCSKAGMSNSNYSAFGFEHGKIAGGPQIQEYHEHF
jgi:hypothetical protein